MNQKESEQNEVDGMKNGADSTGKVMRERAVGDFNEEYTGGRARVTRNEERVLLVD